jgi:acetyltransferase-like isoleucine patch superfamily enzyme
MKNFLKYGVIVLMLVLPIVSFSAEFKGGEQLSIGKGEKIEDDVYAFGGSVMSAGEIDGDLVMAGGNIVISGDVLSDLIVGGGNVNILSNIGDDVRVGGGTVILSGEVKGDAMIGGGQIFISGLGVGGDMAIAGGNVSIDAPVAGNLFVAGGNVYINAPIGGDVKIEAEKITLGSNAVISGNLTYKSKTEIIKEEGAVINGTIDFKLMERGKGSSKIPVAAIFSAVLLWKFLTLLACALVIGLLLRRFHRDLAGIVTDSPWGQMGKGLVTLIVLPFVSILLFMTLVGIPFGIIGLLGFAIMMIFAWILTPIIVGSIVYRYFSKREVEVSWKTILLGVFLYSLLGLVPVLGWLIQALLMFITLGSIVNLKFRILKEWR